MTSTKLSRSLLTMVEGGRVDVMQLEADNRFWALAKALTNQPIGSLRQQYMSPLLAIDPGETTGIAIWEPVERRILLGQLITKDVGIGFDGVHVLASQVSHVRYEDYRVYGHMTEQHAFQNLHTAQMIGAIKVACHLAQVQHSTCLAMHAKAFWTDSKLKMCNLYSPGMKHARDAERHLLRYMCEVRNG